MEDRIEIVWEPEHNQYVVRQFRHGELIGHSYVQAGDGERVNHLEIAMWLQNRIPQF